MRDCSVLMSDSPDVVVLVPRCTVNNAIVMLYFMLILLFLLMSANLAVGVNWVVMWFAVGFVSQPFGFRRRI